MTYSFSLHSLDCWLSYLVLKDKILQENYSDEGFLRNATGAFKGLFTELIALIQPLSLMPFEQLKLNTAPPLRVSPPKASRVAFRPLLEFTFRTPTSSTASTSANGASIAEAADSSIVRHLYEF